MSCIVAIDCAARCAITDDGREGEITDFFDDDGNETDDLDLAVTAVVKVADDEWHAVALAEYQTLRLN